MPFHALGRIYKCFCVTFVLILFSTSAKASIPTANVTDTCGNVQLTATYYPNFITSPGYPDDYSNYLQCRWTIGHAQSGLCDFTEIYIHDFHSESTHDQLTIYNGPYESSPIYTQLSGILQPRTIIATGRNIFIRFTTDGSVTFSGFKLSYSQPYVKPLLSKMVAVRSTGHVVEMSVDILTCSPLRFVHWRRGDVLIQEDDRHNLTTTPARVFIGFLSNGTFGGFKAILRIRDPELQAFGLYKVTVGNSEGISESSFFLQKTTSIPTLHSYNVSSQDAAIMVKFASSPNVQVEWYKTPPQLTGESGCVITTERDGDDDDETVTEASYTTLLKYSNPQEPSYGKYMCVLRNDIGTTEVFIDLEFPKTELPRVLETAVQKNRHYIVITVHFDSNIAHPTATWCHNNNKLGMSDKFDMEMKWKNISSQDWSIYHYPPIPTSTEYERIMTTNVQADTVYNYPSIGRSRSYMQTNANYTAVLTVSAVRPEDFGMYQLDLENAAGISRHLIDVSAPEVLVFYDEICDQEDTIQLICHVNSCTSVTQSWIHSVNDSVIRTFQGHQNDTTNTLTIPTCMYADAGTYTCVATEDTTGRELTIHQNATTIKVRAVPVTLASTVTLQNDQLEIEVPFYSFPSHTHVTWQRNVEHILQSGPETLSVESRSLNLSFHGKYLQQEGHVARMIILNPTAEMFGTYTTTVTNDIGNSYVFLEVENPDYAEPLVSHEITVSYTGNDAVFNLTFTSFFPYHSVKWYFRGNDIQENYPADKYLIQTDPTRIENYPRPVIRIIDVKSSILTVMNVTQEDCGEYQAKVSNEAGQANMYVTLHKEEYGLPTLIGKLLTNKENTTTEILATFYSYPNYRAVRWFKDVTPIFPGSSSKYRVANSDTDIEITLNGETLSRTGTQARLSITSFNKNDKYGVYTVQIYNDVGMTEQSIALDDEC